MTKFAREVAQPSSSPMPALDRRMFLGMAAATAAAPLLARDYGPERTTRPVPGTRRRCTERKEIRQIQNRQYAHPAAAHRNAVGRRPGLERRRAISAVERHPQRRAAALAGRRRPRQRVSQAGRQQQRQHVRLRRAADLLRARQPPRRAVRVQRQGHRAGRKFTGKPLNAPNDAVVHPDGGHLVHRSRLRQPDELRRERKANRCNLTQRSDLSHRRQDGQDRQSDRRNLQAERPLLFARLQSSTSPTPAPRTIRMPRRTSRSGTSRMPSG